MAISAKIQRPALTGVDVYIIALQQQSRRFSCKPYAFGATPEQEVKSRRAQPAVITQGDYQCTFQNKWPSVYYCGSTACV